MRMTVLQIALIAGLLLAAPSIAPAHPAQGCGANPAAMVADAALVRPVLFVGALASSSLYAGLSQYLGFVGLGDSWGHYMVVEPWRYTGGRHVGCFWGPEAYKGAGD